MLTYSSLKNAEIIVKCSLYQISKLISIFGHTLFKVQDFCLNNLHIFAS